MTDTAVNAGWMHEYQRGREDERAAIVEWLRREAAAHGEGTEPGAVLHLLYRDVCLALAGKFENGEHQP